MEPRANYTLIGAFVILAGIALAGFILWIGQNQFRESYDEYDVVFEGPVTLDEGASVRYIGIKVGEVRWVRIDRADPSRVRARIRIDSETPVKTDSTATIDFAGITGVTFIQINAGSQTATELRREPGQPVPVIFAARTQLSELITSGSRILGETGETVKQVNAMLSDQNIGRLSEILANLEIVSSRLAEQDGLLDRAGAAILAAEGAGRSFQTASDSIAQFSRSATDELTDLSGNIDALTRDIQTTLARVDGAVSQGERAAGGAADLLEGPAVLALEDMRLAAQDLRRLTVRFDRIARELEANPQSVVLGDSLPYEEDR